MTTRIPALVAALAVLGGALTACASGPSQTNAAVIFGDRVISVDDVQHRLDDALRIEPAAKELAKNHKLDLVSRGIVNQIVRHELLTAAAQREGLTVSERELADFTASTAPSQDPVSRSIQAAFDPKEIARDQLLTLRLGQKNLDKVQLTLDGVAIQRPGFTRQQATDLARQMAAQPDKAADIGKAAAGQDEQNAPLSGFPINAIRRYAGAAQAAAQNNQAPPTEALLGPLFAIPENSVIVLPLGSGENGGYLVARVRRVASGVPAEDASFAREVPENWQSALGLYLLGPLVNELGLRLSPRYGVWDELAVGVAPSERETVGLLFPAATAKS